VFKSFFTNEPTLRNILMNPHGRRMISAMICMAPDLPGHENALNAMLVLPKEEQAAAKKLMQGIRWSGKAIVPAINLGVVGEIEPHHPEFEAFQALVIGQPSFNLLMSDLAHPALSEASLLDLAKKVPSSNHEARQIIGLNPNAPAKLKYRGRLTEPSTTIFTACAKYGNLKDEKVMEIITQNSIVQESARNEAAFVSLCKRIDIPDALVRPLGTDISGVAYWELMQRPENRRICGVKDGLDVSSYLGASNLKLHPEMTLPTLEKVFAFLETDKGQARIPTWQQAIAQLAAHPNSNEALLERMLVKFKPGAPSFPLPLIVVADAFKNSALEEKVALAIKKENSGFGWGKLALVANCSRETLEWAYRGLISEKAGQPDHSIVTHKNFPWDKFDVQQIEQRVHPKMLPVVRAARYLTGLGPHSAFGDDSMRDSEHAVSCLFDIKLSSKSLDKIALQYPELAPLAAIHPNAENLPVSPESARIVEKYRAEKGCFLSGRGAKVEQKPPAPILAL